MEAKVLRVIGVDRFRQGVAILLETSDGQQVEYTINPQGASILCCALRHYERLFHLRKSEGMPSPDVENANS